MMFKLNSKKFKKLEIFIKKISSQRNVSFSIGVGKSMVNAYLALKLSKASGNSATVFYPKDFDNKSSTLTNRKYCFNDLDEFREQILIVTVGLDTKPLIQTIKLIQPGKIYLLHTKKSEKSATEILDKIKNPVQLIKVSNSIKSTLQSIKKSILLAKQDHPQKSVSICFNGGTKLMCIGAHIAAKETNSALIYLDKDTKVLKSYPLSMNGPFLLHKIYSL